MANSNMKKMDIPRCLQKWYGYHFGYSSPFVNYDWSGVSAFLADFKRWMRRRFSDFVITFNNPYCSLSGFLKMDGKYVYFSIPDVRFWQDQWATNILIHGGPNQYTTIDEFDHDVFDLIMKQKKGDKANV